MRFSVAHGTSHTLNYRPGLAVHAYPGGLGSNRPFRAALFSKRDLDVLVGEDGTNFDVSAQGADVIAQRSKFDFGTLFKSGNFALLHLHGKRELSLGHLTVLTQLIESHALENSVGALFGADAARPGHQLIGDAVVGESFVRHSVLSRLPHAKAGLRSFLQRPQMFPIKFVGLANQLFVKAAPSMFVAANEQDGGPSWIEGKECAKRQVLVVRGAQLLHVGERRSPHGIDIRPTEHRATFPEKVYGCIEGFPFLPRESQHPFPKLRRGANLIRHAFIMRCSSYYVKLIKSAATLSSGQEAAS